MRHLAWLHAVPEGEKKSRLKSYKELSEDHPLLKLPPIADAEYLVALLNEAGLFESSGMGAMPLSWKELNSWLYCTSLQLSTWEILTIKSMSEAYVSEYNQASEKDRTAPYEHMDEAGVKRQEVDSKLRGFFSTFKKKK